MLKKLASRECLVGGTAVLLYLACGKLLLHFLFNGRYGYFRDEFYYMACGEHLAWGYVDQPPLIALIARASHQLLGDSLFAIRFFPAVAGACVVFLTGWIARELGGNRFAQGFSALTILIAPAYLAFDNFLSMNAFEPVFWMICAYLALRILKGGNPQLWLLFGVVAGIGLLNKHSMGVFGLSLLFGLLLTTSRRLLRSRLIWLGGLVALLILLPNLIWQVNHHWPQIEVVRNAQRFKNYPVTPVQFLLEQILFLHPFTFPVWLVGLWFYLSSRDGRDSRCLGWTYVMLLGFFLALKGKTYYLLPAYPMLLAAGSVAIGGFVQAPRRRWLKFALPAMLIAGGLATLPYGLPVLSVEAFLQYAKILPFARSVKTERDSPERLPQLYADMFGWENMVATVARVYRGLSPEDQAKCAILAGDYGEAGAIDFFGRAHQLPKAISGHNNYYLWGPRNYSGEIVISVGVAVEDLRRIFGQVEQAATISNPYAMSVETNLPVYVCRTPKASLQQLWPTLKVYI